MIPPYAPSLADWQRTVSREFGVLDASKLTVVPTPAFYGPNSFAFIPSVDGFAALTAGDINVVAGATINSGDNTLYGPNAAGFSYDLTAFAGGAFYGGLSANNRVGLTRYGTVTGFEFDADPYVNTSVIYHAGNFRSVQSKTAGYTETATVGDQVRLCDLAAGFTVVLPTAVGNSARFTFKKMQAAGSIVIDGNGSETIDGALTKTIATQYDKITIVSDGANWWIV